MFLGKYLPAPPLLSSTRSPNSKVDPYVYHLWQHTPIRLPWVIAFLPIGHRPRHLRTLHVPRDDLHGPQSCFPTLQGVSNLHQQYIATSVNGSASRSSLLVD